MMRTWSTVFGLIAILGYEGNSSACTPSTIADHGGKKLRHAEVQLMFWGTEWGTSYPGPSDEMIFGAVENMLNSPYLSVLNQYQNVSFARAVSAHSEYLADPPCVPGAPHCAFRDSDVVQFITSEMAAGAVAPANPNVDMFYIVVLANKDSRGEYIQSYDEGVHVLGANSMSTYNGAQFNWAWVNNTAAPLTDVNGVTKMLTHELVEGLTDSDNNGVHGDTGSGDCQIGDACGSQVGIMNSYAVQKYWSVADQRCVAPLTWGAIAKYNDAAFNWSSLRSNVRQVAAGGYGLVVTDTNDLPWLYRNGQWSAQPIGSSATMFAVSDEAVYSLASDLSAVYRYDGHWHTVGGPASAIYAGNQYNGGPGVVATSPAGNAYVYTGSGWSRLDASAGSTGSDYAVSGGYILRLSRDHQHLYEYNPSKYEITGAPAPVLQLFAAQGVMAATVEGTGSVYVWPSWSGPTAAWLYQGGYGDMFAASGAGLFGDPLSRLKVHQSTNPYEANPSWIQVGNTAGRLVGGGLDFYATNGAAGY